MQFNLFIYYYQNYKPWNNIAKQTIYFSDIHSKQEKYFLRQVHAFHTGICESLVFPLFSFNTPLEYTRLLNELFQDNKTKCKTVLNTSDLQMWPMSWSRRICFNIQDTLPGDRMKLTESLDAGIITVTVTLYLTPLSLYGLYRLNQQWGSRQR